MTNNLMLKIQSINKSFFNVRVLHGIDFDLECNEIHGLVGENGAGKSTLMNIIGGVLPKDNGAMEIQGNAYEPASPRSATAAGVVFIHQELNLFSNLTVAENMFIDGFPVGFAGTIDKKEIHKQAAEYIEKYDLPVKPGTVIESLPMGTRQMIEIAKALMKKARVIIFDEPTTSLSHREKEKLFTTIQNLKSSGISIIYISHILEDIFRLCDRISVLRDGEIVGTANRNAITERELIRLMVGRDLHQVYPTVETRIPGEVLLKAENVVQGALVKGVSLELRSGEIVGLYGLMGAGRTEFVRTLFGVDQMESGNFYIRGEKIEKSSPRLCIAKGLAFITEDRRAEGLLMPKSVKDNLLAVKLDDILGRFFVIKRKQEYSLAKSAIDNLKVKVTDFMTQPVNSLSGGNQQKVVFGKWLLKKPKIFIMDEPTRGVDVGAKFEIYTIIVEMAKQGAAILMVSSEMEELMGTCDRILVLKHGKISGELSRPEFKQETIVNFAL